MTGSDLRCGTALLLLVLATGCGDGGSSSPVAPTPPTPAPQTRTVVVQGGFDLPADYHNGVWFTTTRLGTLDITVDWTYADSVVWVYVGQGTCTEPQIQAGQCQYILQSLVATPKPRVLTLPNLAAGPYTLLIYNGSARPESVAFIVGLTA
jgi:hypothetical protein